MSVSTQTERLVRVSMMVYKNENFSEDDFHQYWVSQHAPKVVECLKKYGVIRYTQVRWSELEE